MYLIDLTAPSNKMTVRLASPSPLQRCLAANSFGVVTYGRVRLPREKKRPDHAPVLSQEAFVNPQQWLDEYEAKLADLKKKSEDLQENFTASSATVRSKDGSVTVTVGPNGGLQNLQLGRRAMEMTAAQLTGAILQTAAIAQRQAAEKVLAVFQPLGEGTAAMSMVSDTIPADEADLDDDVDGLDDLDEVEEPVAPPPPVHRPASAAPVVRPPTRSRHAANDADDDNQPW